MKKNLFSLLSQVKDWGMSYIGVPQDVPQKQALEVFRKVDDDPVLIGRLTCDEDVYVFEYDPSYSFTPISSFPDRNRVYRSKQLWPFFAIRIPPLDREDVREEITNRDLGEDQVLEILASVAKVSVSNPYEFKLA